MATSSTDIVKRLRKGGSDSWTELAVMLYEAADNIERLRAALRAVIRDVDGYNALLTEPDRDGLTWVSVKQAKEALGDE